MKLHLSQPQGLYQITSYGPDFVSVNGTRHDRSLIVSAEQLLTDWPVSSLDALAASHFAAALERKPEVLLLGTGTSLRFPPPEVLRPLIDTRIGFEVMDTGAACRTYNILVAESRQVLAALIVA